ncbi:calcineurin B-like protein 3 [Chenopodium quinoa]|uniref:calcineurin B-like protein 3 n=1 Tax=Chenopodium quinoa TaxID=63459 RepID=UPI000B775CAE|nr:calcineurin B-like protein 3 [Chenopodium quinoa]
MGGCCMKERSRRKDSAVLAAQTYFSVTEVENLYELFRRLSSSIVDDGFISKEAFQVGLFRDRREQSIFTDRMFHQFDSKHDGLIDFEEFVQGLSIFHPNAPQTEKATFTFQLYDVWETGYIEPEEVRVMILAFLDESALVLSDDIIQGIIDKTFEEADSKGDGKIDLEEWEGFVARTPSILKNMTIPYLKDITTAFPSFVQRNDTEEKIY